MKENSRIGTIAASRAHLTTELRHTSAVGDQTSVADLLSALSDGDAAAAQAVRQAAPVLAQFIAQAEPGFFRAGRLIYFGAGTSGRLGVLDASEAPPTFQVDPEKVVGFFGRGDAALRRSSEGKEDDPHGAIAELQQLRLSADDSVIGIAAGGTTPYVHGGLAWAVTQVPGINAGLLTCCDVAVPARGAAVVSANDARSRCRVDPTASRHRDEDGAESNLDDAADPGRSRLSRVDGRGACQ